MLLLDGLDGEVFNIGNDKETRIIDLAYKIKDITKSDSEIVFQPLPKDDPLRRCPDLTKARNILKYSLKVNLGHLEKYALKIEKKYGTKIPFLWGRFYKT